MSEQLLTTSVRSRTTGVPGRSLNSARDHHFVIDGSPTGGGPAEEITPGEAFLAGISGCGVLMIERRAADTGVPLGLAEAWIESSRQRSDTSSFVGIELRFRLVGPTPEQANALVEHYCRH
jgi:uncharacterized OsmC-like protein